MNDTPETSQAGSREDVYSSGVTGSPGKPNEGLVGEADEDQWICDEEGWWSPKLGGRLIERLQFKFKEGAGEDPYKIDCHGLCGLAEFKNGKSIEDSELRLLAIILSKATSLKVAVHVGEEVTLATALDMAIDPVPLLESLEIQCYVGQTVINSVLDAMTSHKFRRLKALKWVEHNSREAQEAYLGKLAEVIGADMLPHMYNIDLSFDHYNTFTGVENLANSLRCARYLRILRIRQKFMGMGHSALARVMRSSELCTLETLSLIRTGVKDHDCEEYERAFDSEGVPELQELNFSLNEIRDKGAEALGRAFRSGKLKRLLHLDLSKNWIGNGGMIALAEGLGCLPSLKKLYLQSNNFTILGLESLCAALASRKLDGLEVLDLKYNRHSSTTEGALALVDVYDSNNMLTVDIDFDWDKFPQLGSVKDQKLKRNRRLVKVMKDLQGQEVVPTFARVNICGSQEVGKTTLQKSLRRSWWKSFTRIEKMQRREEQTRGIDVSQITVQKSLRRSWWKSFRSIERRDEQTRGIDASQVDSSDRPGESTTLVLWDMAGQEDFHLVHNAFLPDSNFAQGKATIFVIVCRSGNDPGARGELKYWLKFIASSSGMSGQNRRHVLVVINRFNGDSSILSREQTWTNLLQDHSKEFQDYLEIHPTPLILDARRRKKVLSLKSHLMEHSRLLLTSLKVPKICQTMQSQLRAWIDEKKDFRILRWQELISRLNSSAEQWPEDSIDAAARYLHAAGVVLYICTEYSDPSEGANSQNLLVLDPHWFLTVVIGNLFLPRSMVKTSEQFFGDTVNSFDGSISISRLKELYIDSLVPHWNNEQFQDLIEILAALGFCYRDQNENLFIPALIIPPHNFEYGNRGECWGPNNTLHNVEGQWVMGFSVAHQQDDKTIAPMALWHKFQVALACMPEYNGQQVDDDFRLSRHFVTFKCNHMAVLIEVTPSGSRPTFDRVDIFVKPYLTDDMVQEFTRKLSQVDLASNIARLLLTLWNQDCPGVSYVERVVWPWPASWNSRPSSEEYIKKNVEVAEVKGTVTEDGLEKWMQWKVGSDGTRESQVIKIGQLLSTRDKESVVQSVEASVNSLKEEVEQAVDDGIFPQEILDQPTALANPPRSEAGEEPSGTSNTDPTNQRVPTFESPDLERVHRDMTSYYEKLMKTLHSVLGEQTLKLSKQIEAKNSMLQKVKETVEMMFEDKEHSFPRFIYLVRKDRSVNRSSIITFKDALSPLAKVHLQFACEARYGDYGQHLLPNQQGVDVSGLRDWAKKLVPCLKLSITALLISARVAAHVIAPGLGSVFPSFVQWQQASSVSEGVALATGFSQHELDDYMRNEMLQGSPNELYRYSKKAMAEFLRNMRPREFEEKSGLSRVHLRHEDGTFQMFAWLCQDCHRKYRDAGRVGEFG